MPPLSPVPKHHPCPSSKHQGSRNGDPPALGSSSRAGHPFHAEFPQYLLMPTAVKMSSHLWHHSKRILSRGTSVHPTALQQLRETPKFPPGCVDSSAADPLGTQQWDPALGGLHRHPGAVNVNANVNVNINVNEPLAAQGTSTFLSEGLVIFLHNVLADTMYFWMLLGVKPFLYFKLSLNKL